MPAARRHRFMTEDEFLALPESTDRIELIDGEVFVSPSPTSRHQRVLINLIFELQLWARGRDPQPLVGLSPYDVRFGGGRILQPDAFVVIGPIERDPPMPLDRVPDVVIEVLSGDARQDRGTKREVYADAGVPELWLVGIDSIDRRTGADLLTSEVIAGTLTSPLLPGFALDVAALLAG